jgi:hypothetical protein
MEQGSAKCRESNTFHVTAKPHLVAPELSATTS